MNSALDDQDLDLDLEVSDHGDATSVTSCSPPELDYRWLHAGSQHLALLSTPITAPKAITYASFSDLENEHLEQGFQKLTASQRDAAKKQMGEQQQQTTPSSQGPKDGSDKLEASDGVESDPRSEKKPGIAIVGDKSGGVGHQQQQQQQVKGQQRTFPTPPPQSLTPFSKSLNQQSMSVGDSLDSEKYPDPDACCQPPGPTNEEKPQEDNYDVVKGVAVGQVSSILFVSERERESHNSYDDS